MTNRLRGSTPNTAAIRHTVAAMARPLVRKLAVRRSSITTAPGHQRNWAAVGPELAASRGTSSYRPRRWRGFGDAVSWTPARRAAPLRGHRVVEVAAAGWAAGGAGRGARHTSQTAGTRLRTLNAAAAATWPAAASAARG